jgi:transposase InsO family protein
MLYQKNMMRHLPRLKENNEACEGCLLGKQHRLTFPTGETWRAKELLELIHTDVCGPMRTPSLHNNRYFILFIDDFSRMTWVYFMKEKSEVFGIFKKFKTFVEKQSGKCIKVLRSDRGKEYNSHEFDKFCEDEGIERQLTVAYSPQQNGVSERKNRTVMEMARSMIKDKGLPNKFWAEAVYTAVYILNRCPTKAVNDKTPIEAWCGKKPSAKHLRVFGSICYIHVPAQKRHKLEDKSIRGIFLGYSTQSKGYRVYNLQTKKLIVSRDVNVDENASWNWNEEQVERSNITIPIPQSDIEDITGTTEEPGTPPLPPQQETSSPESTPTRVRSLVDIYETCNLAMLEPENYDVASKQEVWVKAMQDEIKMIEKNNTWELVDCPHGKDIIGVKWVYKTKLNPDGSIQKHKARLVAKGYSQQPGVDYNETFAPVARLDTIRALIALAAQKRWSIYQLDVKSAFLNGVLEEEIYVEQPQGFVVKGNEGKVLRLRKALYGLKQAPRAWYSRIDQYFMDRGFRRSKSEPTLYIKTQGQHDTLIVSLYVDDLIFTGNNMKMIAGFKEDMMNTFEMTDLGLMNYFLGIEVKQQEEGIFICQKKYTEGLLKKFKMNDCKPVATPLVTNEKLQKDDGSPEADASHYRSLIGSLLYLTATRPDIMFATSLLSRFMQKPSQIHFGVGKRVLRYLQGTKEYGIWYKPKCNSKLLGYTDSDWAGSVDDMKSTSGYAFSLGSGFFSWASKKQATVAQSTAEAEYIAAAEATSQAIWLRRILEEMGEIQDESSIIYCDNKSTIAITKNPVHHSRTKHIAIKYHFIREAEATKQIQLEYCTTEDQIADIFTKALPRSRFELLRTILGVTEICIKEEC